jgi:hypothetical protein
MSPSAVLSCPRRSAVATLVCLALHLVADAAAGADLHPRLVKLFELGEQSTSTAVAAARKQYGELKRLAPKDPRIDYAYAIVLVNQHKYAEALPLAARYLESDNPRLAAHGVKMWAQIVLHQDAEALEEAVRVSRRIEESMPKLPADEVTAIARVLGTSVGFLERLRSNSFGEAQTDSKEEIVQRLGSELAAVYSEADAKVGQQLGELMARRKSEMKKTADARQERQKQAASDLDQEKSEIAAHQQTIQAETKRLAAVQAEINGILAQIGVFQSRLAPIDQRIASLRRQLNEEKKKSDNNYNTIANLQNDIDREHQRASPIRLEIAKLQPRLNTLGVDLQQSAVIVDAENARNRQARKRATVVERRISKQAGNATAQPDRAVGKAAAFSTYADFPYGQERDCILQWFAK